MASRRTLAWVLVAGAHLALLAGLLRMAPGRPRPPAAPATPAAAVTPRGPALVWVRLPPAPTPDAADPSAARRGRTGPEATPRAARAFIAPSRPTAAEAPPGTPPDTPAEGRGPDAAAPPAAGTTAPGDATAPPATAMPLDLRLPRGAAALSRHPVEGLAGLTGRAVSVPLEARLAAALGSGRWTEERVDGDTVRLRDGGRCLTLKRPRAGQLDVIGDATRQLPWVSDGVKPCGP